MLTDQLIKRGVKMRMVQQDQWRGREILLKPPLVKQQLSPIKFKECFRFCLHGVGL